MIIRRKHKSRFVQIPNAIFNDSGLSLAAMGLLGYLLSRPGNWEVRHRHLQVKLKVGRKALDNLLQELLVAGYAKRDREQGRDDHNRFTTLNYVVSDIPEFDNSVAPTPLPSEPMRQKNSGNKKEEIKTESNNSSPKPPPAQVGKQMARQGSDLSVFGQNAQANGMKPVFVGSKPHEAWRAFRGDDGMPLTDRAIIAGRLREIVWMPSVFPPQRDRDFEDDL